VNTGDGRPTIIVDERFYTAPRCKAAARHGRRRQRAACHHDVWCSPAARRALADGKRLICDRCYAAQLAERGAVFGATYQRLDQTYRP
jgi:hypothetical protein